MPTQLKKSLLCVPLAAAAFFASIDTADAASRRVAFDPDYGSAFPDLGWRGEAIVNYGTCDGPGIVTNAPSSCNGGLSFVSATVELYQSGNPSNPTLQTLNFSGGEVSWLEFDGSNELTAVVSTPFTPKQGNSSQTLRNDAQAYFSLVFTGMNAQLYWFKDNPGNALDSAYAWSLYSKCSASGVNMIGGNECGWSSNRDGMGASLKITPVPEPGTYAMMFAGLGALAWAARRRRAAKR